MIECYFRNALVFDSADYIKVENWVARWQTHHNVADKLIVKGYAKQDVVVCGKWVNMRFECPNLFYND